MALINDEDVKKIAEKVFGKKKFRIRSYEVDQKSERLGFMGRYFGLDVRAFVEDRQFRKIFFIKSYGGTAGGEDFIGGNGIFQKEVFFYSVLLEDLKECAEDLVWCPKYFYSKAKVLVLEDLSVEGFRTLGETTTLDRTHLELALRSLSSMHASSALLEYRKGKTLPSLYPTFFYEIFYDENKKDAPSRKWIWWQIRDLLVVIELLDTYTEDDKAIIREKFADEIMRIYPLSKPSSKYKNVLTHGDVWKNNLLFRYSEGVPIDCKVVDFQFSRYAPPAHDVMHLIHYGTSKSQRDQDETHLLRFYYENLKESLHAHQRDIQHELTWNEFLDSCKEYKELALIQTLLSMHYILGPANLDLPAGTYDAQEEYISNHRNEYMKIFFDKELYAVKIKDILHELIGNYIIKK